LSGIQQVVPESNACHNRAVIHDEYGSSCPAHVRTDPGLNGLQADNDDVSNR
jgi:hypothetical protein